MRQKSINEIVADALKHYMGDRWNQSTLGKAAGVAPNTVGNAMNPERREASASGKEPSITLTQLDRIAQALGVTVADLVSDRTAHDRALILRERAAEYYKEHGELPSWAPHEQPHGKRLGAG